MLFGYTPLDPLVVLIGTGIAVFFLARNPVRLMGLMPTALTIYFFIPTVTLLTLWQTVPLLLTGRLFLKARIHVARFAQPFLMVLLFAFAASSLYAVLHGGDTTRAAVRMLYYLGLFALMSFAYEMGRKPECLNILMRGLVVLGAVLAVYGLYQFVAAQTGLPVRGIVRGLNGAQMPFEGGVPRINSFASEPKRLGYVMFLCGMAALFLARATPAKAQRLTWTAYGIFALSIMTFAASYFLTIALFAAVALLLYPSRAAIYALGLILLGALIALVFPDLGLIDAIVEGYERRAAEFEVGLDGQVVYRQEFYAWDYLANNPASAISGVGLGQYFGVLNQAYGLGVGYSERGALLPLNSNFLELLFDLSGIAAVVVYAGIVLLILRLRSAGETFLCLALLFVTLQSLTILTLQWMVLFAGIGTARLAMAHQDRKLRSLVPGRIAGREGADSRLSTRRAYRGGS